MNENLTPTKHTWKCGFWQHYTNSTWRADDDFMIQSIITDEWLLTADVALSVALVNKNKNKNKKVICSGESKRSKREINNLNRTISEITAYWLYENKTWTTDKMISYPLNKNWNRKEWVNWSNTAVATCSLIIRETARGLNRSVIVNIVPLFFHLCFVQPWVVSGLVALEEPTLYHNRTCNSISKASPR